MGAGRGAIGHFDHAQVVVRLAGNLGQVSDAQDLAPRAEFMQARTDHFGHAAADAGVHFVEYQGRPRLAPRAAATCRARLIRDSSPPEATRAIGPAGGPGFAAT